jgi:hypothetical protein
MTGTRYSWRSDGPARNQFNGVFSRQNKGFSEKEMAFFLNIDFEGHVALVAQIDENARLSLAADAISLSGPARPRWLAPWSTRIKA